jgi:hypothetical protein
VIKKVVKLSQKGFWGMIEDDSGSKGRAKRAAEGLSDEISAQTKWRLRGWWYDVLEEAKSLCVSMGAVDTWTLYKSIRIEEGIAAGMSLSSGAMGMGAPQFEVAASPQHQLIHSQIKAGGLYINPKTGRICNYAESVHEGTGRNFKKGPRPFLTMAIQLHIHELDKILNSAIDTALNKVWVGQ